MKLLSKFKQIRQKFSGHERLIEINISRSALLHNYQTYQQAYHKFPFAPVLKSNAYGHGLTLVAQAFDQTSAPFYCVDSLFEARALKSEGIKHDLLILGYTQPGNILRAKSRGVVFTLSDLDQIREVAKQLRHRQKFHIKIDTGMRRQGLLANQFATAIELIKNNSTVIIEGLYSHLADADGADDTFTIKQIEEWNSAVNFFEKNFSLRYKHLTNSAGSAYADKIDANAARLGLGLYGIDPHPHRRLQLRPALEMTSMISTLRPLRIGEAVGYNITYRADRPMRVATVPVGYFEGVDLRLSNKGCFKINDAFYPILGRVSMNMTSIDVTNLPDAHVGQPVTVISPQPKDKNSVEQIAKTCGTIPYEILVHLPQHLKRTLID